MTKALSAKTTDKYELLEQRFLPDVNSESFLLRHRKTGARVAVLSNDDNNKVFYIAFRTTPEDSTGVAHIIEHTVLCGSKEFPVKDPFIELAKSSLNTFLNAMTYPDKTVYPVASCNLQDFKNLMHVYLDAVFHPNIYSNRKIFEQEGWHWEFDDAGNLTVNGVVYNEMKGALSSADDVLEEAIFSSLYPNTTYANNSGGDPANIPDLTYEAYLDFHRRYYHPSNSYIYLYGDLDVEERLAYLDEAYLSTFEPLAIDSEVGCEKTFSAPHELVEHYSVLPDEETEGQTYFALNFSLTDRHDAQLDAAYRVLDYLLSDAEGAPVREALRKAGIGEDVSGLYEGGIRQPAYSFISRYASAGDKERFVSVIEETLRRLVTEGIDPKALEAAISFHEFRYREADFGSYPKGLAYGLSAMDTWLYDDLAPWVSIDLQDTFDVLRAKAKEGYFEELIRTSFLENPHRTLIELVPEPGFTQKKESAQQEKWNTYASSLSEAERDAIRAEQTALLEWQETEDTAEDLQKIPMLSRADMTPEGQAPCWSAEFMGGAAGEANAAASDGANVGRLSVPLLTHPIFTNKIHYLSFLFSLEDLPAELWPYLPVLKSLFGVIDTAKHSYTELNQEICIATGGISPAISVFPNAKDPKKIRAFFEVSVKVLDQNLDKAFALIAEILTDSDFTKIDRIREVLEEERAGMRAQMPASGHVTASNRAQSYYSKSAAIIDLVSGITAYHLIDDLCEMLAGKNVNESDSSSENQIANGNSNSSVENSGLAASGTNPVAGSGLASSGEELAQKLQELVRALFTRGRLMVDAAGMPEDQKELPALIENLASTLGQEEVRGEEYHFSLEKKNEGFTTAGQVQFVCRAGNFLEKGFAYTGALRVLRVMMGYNYLWNNIRVKGGAYGCMSNFSRDGSGVFVSYRDPHLAETIDVFEGAADFVASFDADERTMAQYIIGAVAALDHPMTPAQFARYSLTAYLTDYSAEDIQLERDQVLTASPADIRALAPLVRAFMSDECLCVIGTAEGIEKNRDLFGSVEKLL